MRQDSAILIIKAFAYVIIGAGTPMASALAQWAGEGVWPQKIHWVCIIIGGVVGGASQLLGFLSGAYSDYVKGRANGQGTDTTQFLASKMQSTKPAP